MSYNKKNQFINDNETLLFSNLQYWCLCNLFSFFTCYWCLLQVISIKNDFEWFHLIHETNILMICYLEIHVLFTMQIIYNSYTFNGFKSLNILLKFPKSQNMMYSTSLVFVSGKCSWSGARRISWAARGYLSVSGSCCCDGLSVYIRVSMLAGSMYLHWGIPQGHVFSQWPRLHGYITGSRDGLVFHIPLPWKE